MKGQVTALIKEMEDACRRPLFTGIRSYGSKNNNGQKSDDKTIDSNDDVFPSTPTESASFGYPESETASNLSIPKSASASLKRNRTDPPQQRSWHEVSCVHILFSLRH